MSLSDLSATNPTLLKIIKNHIAYDSNAHSKDLLFQADETSVDSTSNLSSIHPATSILFQITQQNVLKTELVQLKSLLIHTLNTLLPLIHPPKELEWDVLIQTAIDSPRMIPDITKLIETVSLYCIGYQRTTDMHLEENMSNLQKRLHSMEEEHGSSRKQRELMEQAVNDLKSERNLIDQKLSGSKTTIRNLERQNRDALESVKVWSDKCNVLNRVVESLRGDLEKNASELTHRLKEQEHLKTISLAQEQALSHKAHNLELELETAKDKFKECEQECHRLQGALCTLALEKEVELAIASARTEKAEKDLKEVKDQLDLVIASQHTEDEWHQQKRELLNAQLQIEEKDDQLLKFKSSSETMQRRLIQIEQENIQIRRKCRTANENAGALRLESAKKDLVIGDYRQRLEALTQICEQDESRIKKLDVIAKSRQTQLEALRREIKSKTVDEFKSMSRVKELEEKVKKNGIASADVELKSNIILGLKSKLLDSSKRMTEFETLHKSCVSFKKWSSAVERARNTELKVMILTKDIDVIQLKSEKYARCIERVVEVVASHMAPKVSNLLHDPSLEERANKLSREILGIPIDLLKKPSKKDGVARIHPLPQLRQLIKEEDEDQIVEFITRLILN